MLAGWHKLLQVFGFDDASLAIVEHRKGSDDVEPAVHVALHPHAFQLQLGQANRLEERSQLFVGVRHLEMRRNFL